MYAWWYFSWFMGQDFSCTRTIWTSVWQCSWLRFNLFIITGCKVKSMALKKITSYTYVKTFGRRSRHKANEIFNKNDFNNKLSVMKLLFSVPFTRYEITVAAITASLEGQRSQPLQVCQCILAFFGDHLKFLVKKFWHR